MSKTCIIVPCYNEATRLETGAFNNYLQETKDVSLCFVDDGSTDSTVELITKLQQTFPEKVYLKRLETNQGKASAVREGMLEMDKNHDFDYLGYLDADLATDLESMDKIIRFAEAHPAYDYLMGARISRLGASIYRNRIRHYFGRIFATMASSMLDLSVYDTQCGAKLMKNEIVQELFRKPFISRWLFDVELLFRYKKYTAYFDKPFAVYEYPLNRWMEMGHTRIKPKDFVFVPFELLRIARKYK
ncbi:MAG: glycosyltransferase [Bacteroidota bacterium]